MNSAKPLFLQVHSFYPEYIEQFLGRNPELAAASMDAITQAMLDDGFGATHLVGPYMEKHGYRNRLIIANCMQAQRQWLKSVGKNHGDFSSPLDILALQINTMRPEVVYFTDPVQVHDGFIDSLEHRPECIVGWRAAHVPDAIRWKRYDVMLSSLRGMHVVAREKGAHCADYYLPGFPDHVVPRLDAAAEKDVDITFVGHYVTSIHSRRNELLETVASVARKTGASCQLYLSGELDKVPKVLRPFVLPPVFGMDMYRSLSRSRVVFDARGDIWLRDARAGKLRDIARNETANMRIVEAVGCGSLLFTEERDNIRDFFEPGREIVTYSEERDLAEKLEYFIHHPREGEEIAARGRERCLKEHLVSHRAQQLGDILANRKQIFCDGNSLE